MKKVLSIVLLTALLFTSCKKVSVDPPDPTGPVYVSFAPPFTLGVDTKAGTKTEGSLTGDKLVGDQTIEAQVIGSVGMDNTNEFNDDAIYKDLYSEGKDYPIILDRKLIFNESGGRFSDNGGKKILYPPGDRTIDFLINLKAYSPADVAPIDDNAVFSVVRDENTVTFAKLTGVQDVMVTQMHDKTGSFEAPGTGQGSAGTEATGKVGLTFQRGLSRISFKLAAKPTGDSYGSAPRANTAWGDILKIELIHPNTVTLDLRNNKFTASTESEDIVPIVVHESSALATNEGWTVPAVDNPTADHDLIFEKDLLNNVSDIAPGYGVMVPVPVNGNLTIRITSAKYLSMPRIVTFSKAIEENKYYEFTLDLDEDLGVRMRVTLIDWIAGTVGEDLEI